LKAPEASEKEIKFAQLPPEEFILNNGVTILLKPVSTAQMASMQVLVRGGQWAEAPGKEGQANFLARMLNRGTLDIPDPEFSQLLSRKGISFSASVEPDFFKISLNCAKENFEEGLILASMAITRPGLREEDLKSVKSEIISEIKSINDQTYDLTRQEFNAILYRKNPYRVPLFGYENSVKDISASSMSDFHRKIFCGRNMVIAVCGNFQPDEVLKLLTEIYGEIKAGSYFEYQSAKEPALSQPEVKIIPKERAQVTYNLGWTAPSIRDEDFLPLILAMRMLSAKMFFRFIYEEGICYRMWTRYTENLGPGKFYFETGISPENYNFSKSEVLKELDNFLKQPITEEMLTDAKRESIQKMQLSTESVEAQAFAMAKYYLFGFGPDYLIRYPLMLKNIPAPEVKEVAQKYLNPKKYTLLVVGKVQ
jgi:zinc protease